MTNSVGVHGTFLGRTITPQQNILYESTSGRGFSSKKKDPFLTDATLIKALTMAKGDGLVFFLTYIFAPSSMLPWVFERVHQIALSLMDRVRTYPDLERKQQAIKLARQWLEALQVGEIKLSQSAPERWVAIGYDQDDTLPDWFKSGLLVVKDSTQGPSA
jgi:hypothetical protein